VRTWPPRPVWASALAIAAFQVAGSFGAADNQPERKPIDVLAVVLVLLGPAALAFRERRPVAAAAVAVGVADVYVGLGYPYGPGVVSAVVGLFTAVRGGHRREAWVVAGAGYVGFVLATAVDPRSDGPGWLHLALVAGWVAVVLAVAEVARVRAEQASQRERAERDARRRQVGEQRLALAQELHDVLAHNISLINVQASVALHLLDEQPDRAGPALVAIKDASREALHELRTALDLLRHGDDGERPDGFEAPRAPAPTLHQLDALVAAVRRSGLAVQLVRAGSGPPLPAAVELAAFRIAQEALTNVTRHAHATSAVVRLELGADAVTVEITDDGIGGRAEPGNGLVGMVERAAALGGAVDAGPCPTGGFRVLARLPIGQP
jgi:signal transduction histidine kinase